MKGMFWSNMDITGYLESGELQKLRDGAMLKTTLVDNNLHDTKKYLTLAMKEMEKIQDGFHVETMRKGETYEYDSVLGYEVMINQWAWDHVERQGHFGTRYFSDSKITVMDRKAPF